MFLSSQAVLADIGVDRNKNEVASFEVDNLVNYFILAEAHFIKAVRDHMRRISANVIVDVVNVS